MTSLRLPSRSPWTVLVLLLGVALGGSLVWRARSVPQAKAQVIILRSSLADGGRDLGAGLEVLFGDHLEVLAGATVLHASAVPGGDDLRRLPHGLHLFRFQARREGQRLALTPAWTTIGRLLAGAPWQMEELPPLEPREALAAWIHHWPLGNPPPGGVDGLMPRASENFWPLVEAMALQGDREATAHLGATQALVDREPDCATAWTTLGDHLYRSLWVEPDQAGVGLSSRTHRAFQRAVELVPGHPRATFLWSLTLTDTGNQGLALRTLREAVRLRPDLPDLYQGFAYAGRTAGLLEGARLALTRREALLPPGAPSSKWTVETTRLYLGDWAGFEQDLQETAATRSDASVRFYKGYLSLLKGRREEALVHMTAGDQEPGQGPFQDLCRVYRALLEGRREVGLADLQRIEDVRGKLRIPDGELTFKQAEAYALLGDADRAMDCATRAFVQGFSCARWYETSPFLEPMRTHARWPMLRRNVRERQAVLEGSFPPSAFGP